MSYIPTHNSRETNAVTFAVIIYINMLQLAVQKRVTTSKRIFKFPEDTIWSFRQSTLDRVYGRNIWARHSNLNLNCVSRGSEDRSLSEGSRGGVLVEV